MPTLLYNNSTRENSAVSILCNICFVDFDHTKVWHWLRLSSAPSTLLVRIFHPSLIIFKQSFAGKLPVSFPRSVGTTPIFYNYLKGSRPLDPGQVLDDGTLMFGHQVRIKICRSSGVHDYVSVRSQQSCSTVEFRPWLELYVSSLTVLLLFTNSFFP